MSGVRPTPDSASPLLFSIFGKEDGQFFRRLCRAGGILALFFMDERIHRFLIPILVALCIVSVSLTLSAPVFAADPWSPDVEFGTNVSDSSMREYRDRISATYKFILSMAAPFALVTITVGGLIAFLGSEKDAERGFSMIKMSLIALMALYLLPLVISAAYNSLNGVKWDPAHPDFTW